MISENPTSNYPRKRLRDVGVSLLDCEHRTPRPAPAGYPYIAIPNIKEGRLDLSDVRLISKKDFDSWTKKTRPQAGDIIVTRRARVGDTAVVPSGLECAIGQNLVILRSNGKQLDQSYLRWALRGPMYKEQVYKFMNVGAVFDSLNCADIPKFEVPVPPLHEQRAIARILGSLDDKIEANRRMNETLEAMARAVFKSWFVDFGPVRAKAEGREPVGMDAETAALVPEEFEDSDIGEIPKGWVVRSIGDVVKVLGGGTPSTIEKSYWEGGTHSFCTPKDMSSLTSPILMNTERHLTDKGLSKVSSGQLPIGTVLMSSRAPIGYLALSEIPVSINQGIIAMVCGKELPNLYVLNWAQANMEGFIAVANGSTFLEISKWNFRPIRVLVPPPLILKDFMRAIGPLYLQIVNNTKQSQALDELRNVLLPRLISGDIPVSGRDA